MISPTLFFSSTILASLVSLLFHVNVCLYVQKEKSCWDFDQYCIKSINQGKIAIFTMLSLLIYKHIMCFHLFIYLKLCCQVHTYLGFLCLLGELIVEISCPFSSFIIGFEIFDTNIFTLTSLINICIVCFFHLFIIFSLTI